MDGKGLRGTRLLRICRFCFSDFLFWRSRKLFTEMIATLDPDLLQDPRKLADFEMSPSPWTEVFGYRFLAVELSLVVTEALAAREFRHGHTPSLIRLNSYHLIN